MQSHDNRNPMGVIVRILLAGLSGYGIAMLSARALALTLPLSPVDAVLVAMMGSFLICAVIVMMVFHARSIARVIAWSLLFALPLAIIVIVVKPA